MAILCAWRKGIAHYTKAASRFGAVRPYRGLFAERADGLPVKNSRLLAGSFSFYGGLITFCFFITVLFITFLLLDMISIYSRTERGGEVARNKIKSP